MYSAILLAATLTACSDYAYDPGEPKVSDESQTAVEKSVTIDTGVRHQTMRGIGASDCWLGNWIGRDWTNTRSEIAQMLFSQEIVDGQPQGIGLSMWRVNAGGGSWEIGDRSGITTVERRAESFRNSDGGYDWSKCAGQQYFMEQAKAMGTESFVLFSNTPLVDWTYNGQGRNDRGHKSNLMPQYYDDFAGYLADVVQHFNGLGYNFTHISPINEPNVSWNGHDQEGSAWTVEEAAKLSRELDGALSSRGLSTNILLGELDSWEKFYGNDWVNGGAASNLWTPGNAAYVGDLKHMEKVFGAHSYWTDFGWNQLRDVRSRIRQTADQYGLELWQTEYCMLGDDIPTDEFPGHSAASDMDRALHLSKVMHSDFTVADITSWCYWVALAKPYQQSGDRWLLIYTYPVGESVLDGEGTAAASDNLWVLGNYSLFVRPGFQRVDLTTGESRNFFGSAYISPDGKRLVAVYTNMGKKKVTLNTTVAGFENASVRTFTTTSSKHLQGANLEKGDKVTLDPRSVTTVVYDL